MSFIPTDIEELENEIYVHYLELATFEDRRADKWFTVHAKGEFSKKSLTIENHLPSMQEHVELIGVEFSGKTWRILLSNVYKVISKKEE